MIQQINTTFKNVICLLFNMLVAGFFGIIPIRLVRFPV
jgi:hypothetical protein